MEEYIKMKIDEQCKEEDLESIRAEYEAKIPKSQLLIPKKLAKQEELRPTKVISSKHVQNRRMLMTFFIVIMFAVIFYIILKTLTASSHFMDPVIYYNKAIVEQDESQLSQVFPKGVLNSTNFPEISSILSNLNEQGQKLGGEGYTIVEYLVEKRALEQNEIEYIEEEINEKYEVNVKVTKAYKVVLDTIFKNDSNANTVREELYVYQVNKVWYWHTLDLNRKF